jgi:hypothetical protein
MNTPAEATPLYALVDHRADGRPRIISEYVDPSAARAAADLLRSLGASAEVLLITAVRGDALDDQLK